MSLVILVGLASALVTFPSVRQMGVSLLASAGVAGLVLGVAARPVLGNLIAGLQIALTQPIRLEDVVVIEGEWGRIEQIGSTFVVVRLWDERRQIVPLQWFIEHPFQNWTRESARITGAIFLWVDYRLPLEPLRGELERLCAGNEAWDGRLCKLQVTECGRAGHPVARFGELGRFVAQLGSALRGPRGIDRVHPASLSRWAAEAACFA